MSADLCYAFAIRDDGYGTRSREIKVPRPPTLRSRMITRAVAPWVNNAAWQAPPTTPHQSGCAPPVESWRGVRNLVASEEPGCRTIGLSKLRWLKQGSVSTLNNKFTGFVAFSTPSYPCAELSLRRVILTPSYPHPVPPRHIAVPGKSTRVLPMSKREDDIGRAKNCA